jgi:hypothetical protein
LVAVVVEVKAVVGVVLVVLVVVVVVVVVVRLMWWGVCTRYCRLLSTTVSKDSIGGGLCAPATVG